MTARARCARVLSPDALPLLPARRHPGDRLARGEDGATIRRRRDCEACGKRFTTLETVELKLPAIIKSDGRRENFDARKLRTGFDRALHKRPVSDEQIDAAVRAVITSCA